MESNGLNAKETGKLILIDPNKELVQNEDLFIYVKLKAYSKSRSVILNDSGEEGGSVESDSASNETEVNFIATKIDPDSKDSEGNFTTYATTDYTDIGGLNVERGAVVEGFGINSIDITYNASFVPQVKIKFIDVRGSSLFDVIDKDNRKSPYSMFFKMPYPTFQLTVKGYYGKPVTYCLHMLKWNSSFNADTGDFEIEANFVGFQSAFLSDIKIQNIIGVTNTDSGNKRLSELSMTDKNGGTFPTPKMSDFLNEISRLEIDLADIKTNSESAERIKKLSTAQRLLKNFLTLVGAPIPMNGTKINSEREAKDNTKIDGQSILSPNFKRDKNLIAYRDLIIIKEEDESDFITYAKTCYLAYKEYKKYIDDNKTELGKYNLSSFKFSSDPNQLPPKSTEPGTLQTIINKLYDEDSNLFKLAADNTDFDPNTKSVYKSSGEYLKRFIGKTSFTERNNVVVYDFNSMRNELKKLEIEINDIIKVDKEKAVSEINEELSKKLVINPTIRNVFEVIMNNTQVMLEEIFSVAVDAETYKTERFEELNSETDNNDKNRVIYAFPDVFEYNDETKEMERVWLGGIDNINPNHFPEIKFVDDVINGYIKASNDLKEINKAVSNTRGATQDNWLPINVLDISINPYSKFSGNWSNTVDNVPSDLYRVVIQRAMGLGGYTNITNINKPNTYFVYGFIEGVTASDNIALTNVRKDIINQNFDVDKAIQYAKNNNIIKEEGSNYILIDKDINNDLKLDRFGDKRFIVGDSALQYVNNVNGLSSKIEKEYEKELAKIRGDYSDTDNGIFSVNPNYVYRHDISYLVWGEVDYVNKPKEYDVSYEVSVKGKDIPTIENGVERTEYQKIESKKERIEWILNNKFKFSDWESVIKPKYIEEKYNVGKILTIPSLFAVNEWLLKENNVFEKFAENWIEEQGADFLYSFEGITEEDIKKAKAKAESELVESNNEGGSDFLGLDLDFDFDFEAINSLFGGIRKDGNITNKLTSIVSQTTEIVVTTPIEKGDIKVSQTSLESYLSRFKDGYSKNCVNVDVEKIEETEKQSETTNNSDLKLSVYNYFKTIFDKWVAGSNNGKVFIACGDKTGNNNLIDYFSFVNRSWGDIGDKAACNLSSVINIASDTRLNLYQYIAKILRDSNFLLQILPSYINYRDPLDVEKMFTPITDISDGYSTSPKYVCMLVNGNSKSLQIDEDNVEYINDGIDFSFDGEGKQPKGFDDDDGDKIVAFRVAFGNENQSIFKSLTLNQNENNATGEYYKQLSNLVDKRGKTQSVLQGNDLYDLFSVRSYKCGVSGLGNMNIQPLMMFQLDNVPFFRGAYQILSVEHSITPNDMKTNFTGLRQSSFTTAIVTDATTFMNIDFNEVDEIATKLSIKEFLKQEGIDNDVAVLKPEEDFDFNKITSATLQALGVKQKYSAELRQQLVKYLPKFGLRSNTEVCNFLAQCLHETGFNVSIEMWGKGDGTKWQIKYEPDSKKATELGNDDSGDGKRFKGRGFIQITGKKNYEYIEEASADNKEDYDSNLLNNLTYTVENKIKLTKAEEQLDNLFNIKNNDTDNRKKAIERSLIVSLIWWTHKELGNFKPNGKKSIPSELKKGDIPSVQFATRKVNGTAMLGLNDRIKKYVKVLEVFNLKSFYTG